MRPTLIALAVVVGTVVGSGTVGASRRPDERAGVPGSSTAAVMVPAIAVDGPVFPAPGIVVMVPCGDPLVPLGRQHRLASSCEPASLVVLSPGLAIGGAELTPPARDALEAMVAAAAAEGLDLLVLSAYRSYTEQEQTFAYWVSVLGEREAERLSARPGHSEHQLGTTVDLTTAAVGYGLDVAFAATQEGRWLKQHAAEFGFALTYPEGRESTTGYQFEPWHYRFVGVAVAVELEGTGMTLIEYLMSRWP